jgi:hypothetical protein
MHANSLERRKQKALESETGEDEVISDGIPEE